MPFLPGVPPDRSPATSAPRERFRAFLAERVTTPDALAWYLAEAIPEFSSHLEVQEAVAELVDQAGRLLGFDVTREEELQCSRWRSRGDHDLLVRVVAPADAAQQVGSLSRLPDAHHSLSQARAVSGLGVVCGDPVGLPSADGMIVRRAAGAARLVSANALVSLTRACAAGALGHRDALTLLQPAGVLADPDIAVATRARTDADGG